jgi:hypothetical protein
MYHEVTAAITEELGEWPGSSRRIDWLCFDSDTNFVVSETQTIVIHIEFACASPPVRGVPLKSALWPCNHSIAPGRLLAIIIRRAKIADLGRVNNYVTSHRRQG